MHKISEGCKRDRWALVTAIGLLVLFGSAIIAGCGASLNQAIPLATPTPVERHPPTGTAEAATSFAYLYSRIDYPLQIKVNTSDTVTLDLSLNRNILSMTPTPTSGSPVASAPLPVIPLPTDLQDYQDVAVQVNVQQDVGPVVWQLTSAARESLVRPDNTHRYLDVLSPFTWNIQATGAGENTGVLVLTLIYTYLDGSEHPGDVPLTSAPVPIVAVQPTVANTTLPPFKLPIISLTSFAGVVALLRFLQGIWQAGQNVGDAVGAAKSAAAMAQKIAHRDPVPPTKKRTDLRPPQ